MRLSVKKVRSLIKRRNSSAEEMEKIAARRLSEQETGRVTLDDLSWHPSSSDYYSADHNPRDEVFYGASLDRRTVRRRRCRKAKLPVSSSSSSSYNPDPLGGSDCVRSRGFSLGPGASRWSGVVVKPKTRGSHHEHDTDSTVSVNRSNSFDYDDPSGTFRRSADNDSIEHPPLVTKAKSISDHLDRFRLTVNNDNGAPELSCQDWRDLLPQSTIENLDKKDEEQQHLIWELITTERNYIQMLSTVINTLLGSLRHLQSEKFLTKIEEHNVYLNMEKIRQVHLTFWHQCIEPLISTVRDTGELLNPEILASGCNLFEEELNPLFEYVMTYIDSKSYIKTQQTKNSDFKEYINWCSNEIRRQYNKLDLDDVLIKPIQRIQKYPILLKDILRKTTDEDTRSVLTYFLHKVREFVELLNSRKEEKEEQQKIDNIQDRIDGYNLNNTPSHTPNEQLNQILNKYCKFDLTERVPLLNTQRKFIHESHCKMSTVIDGKSSEAVIFIFSDLILVTRPNKNKKNKNKIIKQPLSLDKIEVEELKDYTNTTVFVYSNEYGSLVEMFLLQSVTQESHNTMLNFINQAKDNYTRDKTKFYTEMDISKTSSITSTDPSSTDLPIPRHQPVCGITRSSSEHYPPARRILLDTSSSVSRAQSMPASNDKRNLVPPKISSAMSSSSSSSSSSGSSSSGSSGLCMDLSRNHTTLPTMDENMRPEDPVIVEPRGNENLISNNNTVQILPVKNIDDVYISENLSSEIKGKLDLEKKFEDDKVRTDDVIFQRSDTIFINHGGDRESKS